MEKRSIIIPKKYYNGENLLSQKDIKDETPSIYMSNTNRSAGKTTFFLIKFIQEFLDEGKQFILLSRNKSEIEDPETMFEYVLDNYFSDCLMTSKIYVKSLVMGIYLDNRLCGFAICLKDSVKLKKYSAIFGKVENALFDELQPEDGRYLRNEVDFMTSIIKTVSRGNGEQSRYIRWVYLSNNISVMNPYFLNMEIYKNVPDMMELKEGEEIYVKGNGYVCEFSYNAAAAQAARENKALVAFQSQNNRLGASAEFMINANAFVQKLGGKMDYIFTLKYGGKHYGVRKIKANGFIYITQTYDPSFKFVVALTDRDHNELTVQLRNHTFYMSTIRDAYAMGILRFSDLEVKNAMIELLGIDLYR